MGVAFFGSLGAYVKGTAKKTKTIPDHVYFAEYIPQGFDIKAGATAPQGHSASATLGKTAQQYEIHARV